MKSFQNLMADIKQEIADIESGKLSGQKADLILRLRKLHMQYLEELFERIKREKKHSNN
jgi:hypothetical protein